MLLLHWNPHPNLRMLKGSIHKEGRKEPDIHFHWCLSFLRRARQSQVSSHLLSYFLFSSGKKHWNVGSCGPWSSHPKGGFPWCLQVNTWCSLVVTSVYPDGEVPGCRFKARSSNNSRSCINLEEEEFNFKSSFIQFLFCLRFWLVNCKLLWQ